MPRTFDNIEKSLLPALQETPDVAERADFCVGSHSPLEQQVLRSVLGHKGRVVKVLARNRLVLGLATEIVAPHVAPGSPLASMLNQAPGISTTCRRVFTNASQQTPT